jgi:CAAX protease family protein
MPATPREQSVAADRRSIVRFVGLALGLSVLYWVAAMRSGPSFNRDVWGAVRGFIPAVAALLTVLLEGGSGVAARIGIRLGRPGGAAYLYGLAVAGAALVVALALAGASLIGPADWTIGELQPGRFILFFFAMVIADGPLGEELGWRGFLLPRLLTRLRPVPASLLVGAVWFLWHLPLYAADGTRLSPWFLASYLVQLLAVATIYTWFFLRSDGSVLLAIVLHDASNYFQFLAVRIFPAMTRGDTVDQVYLLVVTVIGIVAGRSLRRRGPPAPSRQS